MADSGNGNSGSGTKMKKGSKVKYWILAIASAVIVCLLAVCLYLKNKSDNGDLGPVVLYGPPPTASPSR